MPSAIGFLVESERRSSASSRQKILCESDHRQRRAYRSNDSNPGVVWKCAIQQDTSDGRHQGCHRQKSNHKNSRLASGRHLSTFARFGPQWKDRSKKNIAKYVGGSAFFYNTSSSKCRNLALWNFGRALGVF